MIKDLLATEQRLPLERWCRDRARAVPMPKQGWTLCRVLGEYPMVVTLDDISLAPHIALDGFWELWLSIRLARGLKPGWRCIDVGANVGYFTLLMAVITGAEVEAWEPTSELQELLATTLRMNGLEKRVKQRPYAAGRARATAQLFRAGGDYGSASLIRPEAEDVRVQGVITRRLDDVTELEHVDFIKIDAEGFEEEVWAGMEGMLRAGEPKAMLMEWTPRKYRDAKGFLEAIKREGFSIGIVDHSGGVQKPVGDITAIGGHLDLWLER